MFVRLLYALFDMRLDRLVRCRQLVCTCSVWEELHFRWLCVSVSSTT